MEMAKTKTTGRVVTITKSQASGQNDEVGSRSRKRTKSSLSDYSALSSSSKKKTFLILETLPLPSRPLPLPSRPIPLPLNMGSRRKGLSLGGVKRFPQPIMRRRWWMRGRRMSWWMRMIPLDPLPCCPIPLPLNLGTRRKGLSLLGAKRFVQPRMGRRWWTRRRRMSW